MIGYGQYIAKLDGGTGADGTLTPTWFNLGSNWKTKSFFNYYSYLGVVAYNIYSNEYQILLLDGSSGTQAVKRISVPDTIISSFNINNDLIFNTQSALKKLGDNGLETILELSFEKNIGTLYSFNTNRSHSDELDNKIYISASNGAQDLIFSFGKKDANNPYLMSQLYDPTGASMTMIKGSNNLLFVSSYTGAPLYLQYFSSGNGAGTLKYPFKDIGQKVRVNYVKYYFKTLVSGDSLTAGLDIDYGTSVNVGIGTGNISFDTDGAVTSKRFDIKQLCHSFRPTLSWVSGGTSLSHVVVEYETVDDN
jgi:hypothetical protein